ncbi:MAG TPA: hypothetical protein VF092_19680 [Longimicrobium sp.]
MQPRDHATAGADAGHPREPSPGYPFDAGPLPRLRAALHCPAEARRLAWRRAAAAAAVAWLPLLVLSSLPWTAGPSARPLFLRDVAAHARYLAAIPLLVGAEPWCLPQLASIVRHFTGSGLIAGADRARWDALVARARRLLDGRGEEVALPVAAYLATALLAGVVYPHAGAGWVAPGGAISAAGWWRVLVSQPLFLLCLLGWLWRVAVWARLLWGASRLPLRLVPSHPDLAGGLRFVAVSLRAFAPVALAIGTVVSGTLAGEILAHTDPAPRLGSVATVAVAPALALALFAAPLLVFAWPLHRARLRGTLDYGALAGALGRRFEERWIRPADAVDPGALEVQDFSATTDLYSIVANVRGQVLVPVGVRDLLTLAAWALLPFIPLLLLLMPLSEVLSRMAELLL